MMFAGITMGNEVGFRLSKHKLDTHVKLFVLLRNGYSMVYGGLWSAYTVISQV